MPSNVSMMIILVNTHLYSLLIYCTSVQIRFNTNGSSIFILILLSYRPSFVLGAKSLTSYQCSSFVQVGSFATEQFQNWLTLYLNSGVFLGDITDSPKTLFNVYRSGFINLVQILSCFTRKSYYSVFQWSPEAVCPFRQKGLDKAFVCFSLSGT